MSYSGPNQYTLKMILHTRSCKIEAFYLYCSINVCHRSIIVGTAINFGFINYGITRFKDDW